MNLKISDKSVHLEWNPWNLWINPRIYQEIHGFIHKNADLNQMKKIEGTI